MGILIVAAVAYYLLLPLVGPHFVAVCRAAREGLPGRCEEWDAGTAFLLNLFNWLDDHNGVVSALAGVTVAIFTGVLWNATVKLWEASEKTARQSVTAEMPYLHPSLPNTTLILPSGSNALYPTSPGVPRPRIQCKFANVGRHQGVVRVLRGELLIGDQLPVAPTFQYSSDRLGTIVVRADTETDWLAFDLNRNLTTEEITKIGGGETPIYFFGYVKYTDVFDQLTTKGFCFRVSMGPNGLIELAGGEAYNYRRSEKTPPEFLG